MEYNSRLWRDYAQVYDAVLNVLPYQNLLLDVLDMADVQPGMRLFDGCCGTGNLLWAIKLHNVICDVTCVDMSKDMLAKAREKQEGLKSSVKFVQADLDEPVSTWKVSGNFERFIFNNCLAFLPDPASVLLKAGELAEPGAVLVASTPRPNPNINEILEEHLQVSASNGVSREEAMQGLLPKLQPIIASNEQLMRQYGDSYHLPNQPQLRQWFADSGWEIETITTTYAGQNWLVKATKV